MKYRILAAALAAFFMLPFFGLVAFAADLGNITDTPTVAESMTEPEDTMDIEDEPEIEIDLGDMSALLSLFMLMGMLGGNETPEISALPPGTASVIDYNTDPDGRLFYTIMTPDEYVFFLVIDKNSVENNVYFLNAVTITDLIPLAQMPAQKPGGSETTLPNPTGETGNPTEPLPPADKPQGGNTGMYIIIGLLVIAGGGLGWYFKIYKPKQERMGSDNEYDPSMDEIEISDDWGDDSDDSENTGDSEEADESDDSPPWDEDGENGDDEL